MTTNALNQVFKGTIIERTLSEYGRRAYFPKGIVAQSQEAREIATYANATAGVALQGGHYMSHSLFKKCDALLTVDEMVGYAPTAGEKEVRLAWQKELIRKNPPLKERLFSLPIVSAGLTHALTLAGELFLDPTDEIIVPSPSWDNYDLIFGVKQGCSLKTPPLFDKALKFSTNALANAISEIRQAKIFIVLNFPNNPSGYTPTREEAEELRDVLVSFASRGKSLVVVIDDAYWGLFHTPDVYPYSLFTLLSAAHENILAIKCDAATKEALVWGFRLGFITYGSKGLSGEHYQALMEKTTGAIRASVSSASKIGQSLLLKVLHGENFIEETTQVAKVLKERYVALKEAIAQEDASLLTPLPFNSGYFCTFVCKGEGALLREELLKEAQIGTVALEGNLLRVAYSSVDLELIAPLIKAIYSRSQTLWR